MATKNYIKMASSLIKIVTGLMHIKLAWEPSVDWKLNFSICQPTILRIFKPS